MSLRTTCAAAGLAMLAGLPTAALANSTGNPSNNPAVIQGLMPPPEHLQRERSAALRQEREPRKVCDFNGSESGSRNPDYVTCFN